MKITVKTLPTREAVSAKNVHFNHVVRDCDRGYIGVIAIDSCGPMVVWLQPSCCVSQNVHMVPENITKHLLVDDLGLAEICIED